MHKRMVVAASLTAALVIVSCGSDGQPMGRVFVFESVSQ